MTKCPECNEDMEETKTIWYCVNPKCKGRDKLEGGYSANICILKE